MALDTTRIRPDVLHDIAENLGMDEEHGETVEDYRAGIASMTPEQALGRYVARHGLNSVDDRTLSVYAHLCSAVARTVETLGAPANTVAIELALAQVDAAHEALRQAEHAVTQAKADLQAARDAAGRALAESSGLAVGDLVEQPVRIGWGRTQRRATYRYRILRFDIDDVMLRHEQMERINVFPVVWAQRLNKQGQPIPQKPDKLRISPELRKVEAAAAASADDATGVP